MKATISLKTTVMENLAYNLRTQTEKRTLEHNISPVLKHVLADLSGLWRNNKNICTINSDTNIVFDRCQ